MQKYRVLIAILLRRIADWLAPADQPKSALETQVAALINSPVFEHVLKAVRKQNADSGVTGEARRLEALEWAKHYSGYLLNSDAWETRFLVELAVGLEKGKLQKDQ